MSREDWVTVLILAGAVLLVVIGGISISDRNAGADMHHERTVAQCLDHIAPRLADADLICEKRVEAGRSVLP